MLLTGLSVRDHQGSVQLCSVQLGLVQQGSVQLGSVAYQECSSAGGGHMTVTA